MSGVVYKMNEYSGKKRRAPKRKHNDSASSPLVSKFRECVEIAVKASLEAADKAISNDQNIAALTSAQVWADALCTLEEVARRMATKAQL